MGQLVRGATVHCAVLSVLILSGCVSEPPPERDLDEAGNPYAALEACAETDSLCRYQGCLLSDLSERVCGYWGCDAATENVTLFEKKIEVMGPSSGSEVFVIRDEFVCGGDRVAFAGRAVHDSDPIPGSWVTFSQNGEEIVRHEIHSPVTYFESDVAGLGLFPGQVDVAWEFFGHGTLVLGGFGRPPPSISVD